MIKRKFKSKTRFGIKVANWKKMAIATSRKYIRFK